MRQIINILLVVILVVSSVYSVLNYYKKIKNRDTVVSWQPVVYTYKDYTGSPGIDEPEFYEIVKQKNAAGSCYMYYTKYTSYPLEEVLKYSDTDTDAMFELAVRRTNDRQLIEPQHVDIPEADYFLLKAADLGHIQAKMYVILFDFRNGDITKEEALSLFDKYEKRTPRAVFERVLFLYALKEAYPEAHDKLKNAGNYYYMLALAAKIDLHKNGSTDKDIFCEAYFNGCNLYEAKTEKNISCQSPL